MALFDQLQAATQNFTPGVQAASPVLNSPEISNFYASSQNLVGSAPLTSSLINESAQKVNRDEEARSNEAEKLKGQLTGSGYQRTTSANGGYNFFDAQGNPISAFQYARAKGVSLADALQGSADAGDQKIQNEYSSLLDVTELVNMSPSDRQSIADESTGETYQDYLNSYYEQNPGLNKLTAQQLVNRFMNKYSHMFKLN